MNDGFWQVCVFPSFWLLSFGCTLASRILWLNEGVAAPASMIIICFSGPTFPLSPFPPIFLFSTHVEFPWSSCQFATSFVASTFWKKGHAYTHTCLILFFKGWPIFIFQEGNKEGNEILLFTLLFSPSFNSCQNSKSLCMPSPVFLLFFLFFFFFFLFLSPKQSKYFPH